MREDACNEMNTKIVNHSAKKKFFAYVFIFIMLMAADMLITYINMPDLDNEANPLVKVFGLGWGALIVQNIISILFYSGFVYYVFVLYKRPILQCEGFKQYVSMLIYGCPAGKKTKHVEWKNFWAVIGNMFAIGYIIVKAIVILDWIGVLNINPICHWFAVKFRSILPIYWGITLLGIAIHFCCYYCVLYHWYRMNKKQLECADT